MTDRPAWMRNEFQQINTDFSDAAVVERYEAMMGEFRDLAREDAAILAILDLPAGRAFWRSARARAISPWPPRGPGCHVTAVDVSQPMLDHAAARAKAEGLDGRRVSAGRVHLAGGPARPRSTRPCRWHAMHHLPDLWKAVALAQHPPGTEAGRAVPLVRRGVRRAGRRSPAAVRSLPAAMPPAMRERSAGPHRQRVQHARLDHGRPLNPGRLRHRAHRGRAGPDDPISMPGRMTETTHRQGLNMIIRPETASDYDAIRNLLIAAFADHPYSHQTEHLIVEALRADAAIVAPLVAEVDGQVVGHVAFSLARIGGADCQWYTLGPVAVLPEFQRRGIGSGLVEAGLQAIRGLGAGAASWSAIHTFTSGSASAATRP